MKIIDGRTQVIFEVQYFHDLNVKLLMLIYVTNGSTFEWIVYGRIFCKFDWFDRVSVSLGQ